MINKATRLAAIISVVILVPQFQASAWEATYNQNVGGALRQLRSKIENPNKKEDDLVPFNPSKIEYPADQGAQLGQGWDFFLNQKMNSACVDFKVQRDNYETAELDLHEATDEETRDVTLNMTFSIAGGGSYAGYGGKGNSSLTKNSFSHYYSKDVLVVTHVSITNGAVFAVPTTVPEPSGNGFDPSPPKESMHGDAVPAETKMIKLLPGLADLKRQHPELFRSLCGDGFVATINFGTDLYALLNIHESDAKSKELLETAVQTSGGFAGFTGSGSGSISQLIEQESKNGNLTIQLVQRGGKIKTLPVDLESLQTKLKDITTEAWEGAKPIYMVVFPYSKLPEFQGLPDQGHSTALEAALRYYTRLQSVHAELLDMEVDFNRDQGTSPSYSYYFSLYHQMRPEDLDLLREALEAEINRISDLIQALSKCPTGCDEQRKEDIGNVIKERKSSVSNAYGIPDEMDFDDFEYWIQLPLPMSAIPPAARTFIQDAKNDYDQKRRTYARYLFQHWVQRQDAARCSLYSECLSQSRKFQIYDEIIKTLNVKQSPALLSLKKIDQHSYQIEVKPCTQVYITNSRSAEFANAFTISGIQGVPVSDQPGGTNVNKLIASSRTTQQWALQAWYYSGGILGQLTKYNMLNSTPHFEDTLSPTIWFQDSGSPAAGPPNLTVMFQAIPEPPPACTPTAQQ